MHRIVAEGHFVRVVAVIPLGMSIGEKDVLTLAMRLPFLPRKPVGRAADTILRVIILVGIGRLKIQRVAGQHISGRKQNPCGVHRRVIIGNDTRRPRAVEIIEKGLLRLRHKPVRRAMINIRVLDAGNNLLHPARAVRVRVGLPPGNQAAGFGITPVGVVRIHRQAQADLMQVGIARDGPRALLGRGQRRQQHCREDGDDGNDHQKFNQGECTPPVSFAVFLAMC